jgi:radical SAM superfamily enzyme YgiQ (UPF0313 family)
MRTLLIIPPLTQLNTPYPSTAYLTGFLASRGYQVDQADVGIELALALFSRDGLSRVFEEIRRRGGDLPGEARQMLALRRVYLDTVEPVVGFLQGRDAMLGPRICQDGFLPRGPRFVQAGEVAGSPPAGRLRHSADRARYLATLYLEDLADLIQATVAPQFTLSRYAEAMGTSAAGFDGIARALAKPPSLSDELMLEALWRHVERTRADLVGFTVPFPGNLYGALRMAQALKARRPDIRIALGGGYANTELRRLQDPRVFDYFDFITLDDGERPLLCLLEHLAGKREEGGLRRTFLRRHGRVLFCDGAREPEFSQTEVGTPTYRGLPLDRYLSVLDSLNPMHRLWSEGHWNKLTVAHGCYWKQCTFCDVGLDYIARYEASPSELLADRIEALIAETGRRGFHFVDEAAPPAGLKGLALIMLERGIAISWWGNIRFEAAFTPDLCRLLAASGCVAVTVGLEAATDRVLEAMKKGITVDQAARVAAAFHRAGILVHAYLMYGYPGETLAETVESLERVRQLFVRGLIQSAFWHRFVATAHSPIGLDPAAHGIRILGPRCAGFADNDLAHEDPRGAVQEWVGRGLRTALFNYREEAGMERDVRQWFTRPVPRPRVPRDWVSRALADASDQDDPAGERRLVWIGGRPESEPTGRGWSRVILPNQTMDVTLRLPREKAAWFLEVIREATPAREKQGEGYPSFQEVRAGYPFGGPRGFDRLLATAAWRKVRAAGLLPV